MDFSAKNLKETVAEKQKLAEEEKAARKLLQTKEAVNSKTLKAFIELNKPHLFKSALNKRMSVQLLTPRYYEKWWNYAELTKFVLDRGFEIIDFDNEYFGVWFGEIHQLDFDDLETLEQSLLESYNDLNNISDSINNRQLKEVINSYKSNDVPQINVLRLLVVFHKLTKLNYFVDEDDETGLDVAEIDILLSAVEENVSEFLPNNFNRLIAGTEDKSEFFTISWRFPYESVVHSDGLTAANLNWLSSKLGNDTFLKFYELIKVGVESTKSFIEISIDADHDDYFIFKDEKMVEQVFEMPIEDVKNLLEALDFKVGIVEAKGAPSNLRITWE
jgi:hypothetical protein